MYYFQTAIKDTTLYLQQETQNTGLDEVLEISKTYYGIVKDIAHPLLKFDINEVSSSISNLGGTIESSNLILKECESTEIPLELEILAYPVSQSWEMGIGTRFDDISSDGATWYWSAVTGSNWSNPGGDIVSTISGSETLTYLGSDLSIDVLNITNEWINGNLDNHGFLLKFPVEYENNNTDYGILQYFSKETNTIYQPKLRLGWDDQEFVTGSTSLTEDDIAVNFKRLKSKYKLGSVAKIQVVGREQYPLKTYTNQYSYTDFKYLPITTWYQIKDALTHEIIIPFSDYTKVSCDGSSNFFKLNFSNWEIGRDYYIEIKTDRIGETETFGDNNLTFRVEK